MAANTTTQSQNASFANHGDVISWTVAFSIQFFVSIVGNVLILWIIFTDNRLKTTTNYLVANMAVSDLLAALFAFPKDIVAGNFDSQWLIRGDFGAVMCKLVTGAVSLCFIVSINTCVAIAIDRYYAVAHPFSRPFQRRMKGIIAGIWLWSSLVCSPGLFYASLEGKDGKNMKCTASSKYLLFKVYKYVVLMVTFSLPVLLVITAYILTMYKLYRHKAPGLPNIALKRREHQNRKVLKMAVTIVALLYLCHGSWMIYIVLSLEENGNYLSLPSFYLGFVFLLYMSLCYNFFIYLIFNDIYRERIKTMMARCCWGFRLIGTNASHPVPGPTMLRVKPVM